MATTDGGPAFPRAAFAHNDADLDRDDILDRGEHGMSLRDWFAGHALAGILSRVQPYDGGVDAELLARVARRAQAAYRYADAMLAQRAAGGPAGEG